MAQGQARSDVREWVGPDGIGNRTDGFDARRQRLTIDAPLEVWCSFDNAWVRGFAVHDVTEAGVIVRRTSDGAVLPKVFQLTEVRVAVQRY